MICVGCDGKKLVNHIKMNSNGIIITKMAVRKCLKCKGTGEL